MANQLKADVVILKVKQGINGKCIEIMVRWRQRDDFKLEVKIMVLGEYACGKSTLLGTLVSGVLDNGKGKARMSI